MRPPHDLDDTASFADESARTDNSKRLDWTDELELAGSYDAPFRACESGRPHAYAQGIIRLYRARTILLGEAAAGRGDKAWSYLQCLQPEDLPPRARRPFLELVYAAQESTDREYWDSLDFRDAVLGIAAQIDAFVDAINSRYDI